MCTLKGKEIPTLTHSWQITQHNSAPLGGPMACFAGRPPRLEKCFERMRTHLRRRLGPGSHHFPAGTGALEEARFFPEGGGARGVKESQIQEGAQEWQKDFASLLRFKANILEETHVRKSACFPRRCCKVNTCFTKGPPDRTVHAPLLSKWAKRRTRFCHYSGDRFLRGRERAELGS